MPFVAALSVKAFMTAAMKGCEGDVTIRATFLPCGLAFRPAVCANSETKARHSAMTKPLIDRPSNSALMLSDVLHARSVAEREQRSPMHAMPVGTAGSSRQQSG